MAKRLLAVFIHISQLLVHECSVFITELISSNKLSRGLFLYLWQNALLVLLRRIAPSTLVSLIEKLPDFHSKRIANLIRVTTVAPVARNKHIASVFGLRNTKRRILVIVSTRATSRPLIVTSRLYAIKTPKEIIYSTRNHCACRTFNSPAIARCFFFSSSIRL